METPRELRRRWEDTDDLLRAQYGRDVPYCEMLHAEVGLDATPPEDPSLEDLSSDISMIRKSPEHADLHAMLEAVAVEAMLSGARNTGQLVAKFYVLGRRDGMREAARMGL